MRTHYNINKIAEETGKSERTIRRWLNDLVIFDKGKYLFSEEITELIRSRANADNIGQQSDTLRQEEEYDYVEGFTTEEYIEFQKRINEYSVLKEYIENLKEQIEFLRFNIAQQNDTIKNLSDGIKQRNFIEAKEKGMDK